MMTYPLFLMRNPDGTDDPVIGLDMDSKAVNNKDGHSLFDKKGKPSLWLGQQKNILMDDVKNNILTQRFLQVISEKGLLREVNVDVHYADEQISQIRGLFMVHEDNLQKISKDSLVELRDAGYLPAIYAMLFSVFQLNALILRHNQTYERSIARISLEVRKDHQIAG